MGSQARGIKEPRRDPSQSQWTRPLSSGQALTTRQPGSTGGDRRRRSQGEMVHSGDHAYPTSGGERGISRSRMFTGVRVMLAERDRPSGIGYPCSSAASVTCWFQRCVRGMRRNSPSPRPAAFPPPSPPPMSLGIIRRFTGAMQPSDSSPVCMPIVRLLPSWAGPTCRRTQMRSPRFQRKDVSTCMGSSTARGSSSASQLRGADVALRPTARRQHHEIRPVSQLNTQPVVSPVNASSWPSRAALASLGAGAAG